MSDTTNGIQIPPSTLPSPSDHPSEVETTTTTYDKFLHIHRHQLLNVLQIPEPLIESLYEQLQNTFVVVTKEGSTTNIANEHHHHHNSNICDDNGGSSVRYDMHHATKSFHQQLIAYNDHYHHIRSSSSTTTTTSSSPINLEEGIEYGTIMVLPHVVTWDMLHGNSFINALLQTDLSILQYIYDGLQQQQQQQQEEQDQQRTFHHHHTDCTITEVDNKINLVNAIADHPMVWSRTVLFRSSSPSSSTSSSPTTTITGALLPPPYLPHVPVTTNLSTSTSLTTTTIDDDIEEADCTGPFTFQYQLDEHQPAMIDVSLLYVSPEGVQKMIKKQTNNHHNNTTATTSDAMYLPSIDLVPKYQYPNQHQQILRIVRYVVLELLPNTIRISSSISNHPMILHVKAIYTNFIHQMHMKRQQMLEQKNEPYQYINDDNVEHPNGNNKSFDSNITGDSTNHIVYRVYTDSDDPMELHHPIVGLEQNSPYFKMVSNIEDADIVYSYQSIFSPNYKHYHYIQERNSSNSSHPIWINQFPYEGAFVQKDHLARGILQQHGLPRPTWSIETYDLDVHFTEFVGSVLFTIDDEIKKQELLSTATSTIVLESKTILNPMEATPLWIIKPASGTQSQGHIVTRNLALVLRINDASGGRRVAQRYIERPVCINNHKVDCRVIVVMTSAGSIDENGHILNLPTLYMHNICYFRIANKEHNVSTPIDRNDHESVLTASHLLKDDQRTTNDELRKLPQHKDTIQQLENEYPNAFDWDSKILPQIKAMIRELFNGMTTAYPKMIEAKYSRAVYGVDVMFQIDDCDDDSNNDMNGDCNLIVTPKLTEVTFCPANNAICDAYVRDDELYRTYNKDIFECMFLGIVSNNITRLQ